MTTKTITSIGKGAAPSIIRTAANISNPPYTLPRVSERKLNIPFPKSMITNIIYISKKWKFLVIIATAAMMSTNARNFSAIFIKIPK